MNTVQTTDSKKSNPIKKPAAPAPQSKPETKPQENRQSSDAVSLSNEKKGEDKGFSSFLDNFKSGFADVTGDEKKAEKKPGLGELKGKELKAELDKLQGPQKEKAVLDSLKGLKGEELQSRLAELDKVDKKLADKIREKLGLKSKEEDKKEAKPTEGAKKAGGGDTGAPSETFLWKPQSESDGKLVILLPTSVSARSVTISGPNVNQTVSKGGRNGKRANGQREHFRFGKGGKEMQGPVQVTVMMENGQKKTMNIANPSQRNEGGKLKDAGMPAF